MSAVACLTVYRQAVTLPNNGHDHGTNYSPSPSPVYAIVAEIAARLDELDELQKGFGADLISQLAFIARTSRRSFDITVHLLHGDLDQVLSSYQDQASARGVTKQDIHYEFAAETGKLQRLYPKLYAVIMSTRAQCRQHEDPIARSEVACATSTGGVYE